MIGVIKEFLEIDINTKNLISGVNHVLSMLVDPLLVSNSLDRVLNKIFQLNHGKCTNIAFFTSTMFI